MICRKFLILDCPVFAVFEGRASIRVLAARQQPRATIDSSLTVIEPLGRIQQGSAGLPGLLGVTLRVPSTCTLRRAQWSPSIR